MAIVLSENWSGITSWPNGALPAGWTASAGVGGQLGGCGFGNGINVTGKRFISCSTGNAQHTFVTGTAQAAVRVKMAFLSTSFVGDWEPFYLGCPAFGGDGFLFVLILRPNGQISIRTNNVASETLGPSATGVYPTDGTAFALQWRMTINSSTSVGVAVDINNVTVWTRTYTSTDNVVGTNQWNPPTNAGTAFTYLNLLPVHHTGTYNTAFSDLEVDNSSASVSWPICSGFEALGTARPQAVTTGLSTTVGSTAFTVTGTSLRYLDQVNGSHTSSGAPSPVLKMPDGTILFEGGGIESPLVYADTTISGDLTDPAVAGVWCARIEQTRICWEANPGLPAFACQIVVDTFTVNCTDNQITITGTALDTYSTLVVTGPDGETWTYTVISVAADELVIELDDPITTGLYCITIDYLDPVCVSLTCGGVTSPICRKIRFPLPFNQNLLMFLQRLEFLIQSGVSSNATITIRLSRDGGYTWPITRTLTAGAMGAYDWRVYSTNFGQGRNWVCEFITDEPAFWALIQCYADMEQGTS